MVLKLTGNSSAFTVDGQLGLSSGISIKWTGQRDAAGTLHLRGTSDPRNLRSGLDITCTKAYAHVRGTLSSFEPNSVDLHIVGPVGSRKVIGATSKKDPRAHLDLAETRYRASSKRGANGEWVPVAYEINTHGSGIELNRPEKPSLVDTYIDSTVLTVLLLGIMREAASDQRGG